MECGVGTMDIEEIGVASAAAPMVDDDNEPAPENRPLNGETDSGICERKALISRNAKPVLSFWTNKSVVTGRWGGGGGGKPGPLRSGIQRWFTTTSCIAMLWMTTMESDTHQSA